MYNKGRVHPGHLVSDSMQTRQNFVLVIKELPLDLLLANSFLSESICWCKEKFVFEPTPLHYLPLLGPRDPVIAITTLLQLAPFA